VAQGDLTLNVSNLTGLSGFSPQADDATPQNRAGALSFIVDAFGFRVHKYVKAIAGATKGLLMQSTGDTTTPFAAIANVTAASSTTSATTSGLTANDHQGKIVWVQDDAGAAGAAPEGEHTIVASNTTTVLKFEPDLPLSTALAVNDDLSLIATYQAEVGTGGALGAWCQGVVTANGGITAGNYGWVQQEGHCIATVSVSTALTAGMMLRPGSTGVLIQADITTSNNNADEWVGICLGVVSTDQVATKVPVRLKIFTVSGTSTLP
jgi:hypothetical protein